MQFGAGTIAFLWPSLKGGFGSKVVAGDIADIKSQIQSTKQPFYVGIGRFYLVPYNGKPTDAANDYEALGVAAEGLMPLYQRCVHLGCRVPFCQSSQWFECPCHGSKYNEAGEYQLGPAPRGMDRFKIEIDLRTGIRRHLARDPGAASRHRHDPRAPPGQLLRGAGLGIEGAEGHMLAISSGQIVILIVGGSLLLLAGLGSLVLRGRRPEPGPDIPPVMRPGPSDADLETPVLQKLQGWGVVLVAFFVVWIPIVWLQEPTNNFKQEEDLLTASIERGSREVQLFSEENQLGVGCVRCHGPELRGGTVIPNGTDPETGDPEVRLSAEPHERLQPPDPR